MKNMLKPLGTGLLVAGLSMSALQLSAQRDHDGSEIRERMERQREQRESRELREKVTRERPTVERPSVRETAERALERAGGARYERWSVGPTSGRTTVDQVTWGSERVRVGGYTSGTSDSYMGPQRLEGSRGVGGTLQIRW